MIYGVYNLETGELDMCCDEEAVSNFDREQYGFVDCPGGWTWNQTHVWNSVERHFEELGAE